MDEKSAITLHTGSAMPVIGLGTWQLTKDTPKAIQQAIQAGYRMIDTSGDYGTQPGIAEGIKRSGVDRDDLYIVTKVEEDDDAYLATKKNLDELQLDYADLMLIHRPPQTGAGEALWEGLQRAKQEGLTKDIGVSNYSIRLMRTLMQSSAETPVVNQIEWSPFGYSDDVFVFCEENDILIQAYSPLTRAERLDDERLVECAATYNKTPAQLLIRWNMQLGTIPLPKANQHQHMLEDLDVFDFEISDDDMSMLNGLNEHYSALGHNLAYL